MSETTRCAVLTPPGSAAVATIALVGTNAWSIVRTLFRPSPVAPLPKYPVSHRHWFGQFGLPASDDVVIAVRHAGPMPWIEIHCHGGSQVVQWILMELQARGAASVPWTELVSVAERSPLQAAAEIQLTRAVTLRTAAILLDQFHGALDRELDAIQSLLRTEQLAAAHKRLAKLMQFSALGRHLTEPWRVVLAGQPNVGKSSLINRLVGYPRCVVTPIAGTTRDIVSTQVAIDGWPVELIDTAGQRQSGDPLEMAGVSLAEETISQADLVLWLYDGLPPSVPNAFLKVRNKIDLAPRNATFTDAMPISALTGEGLDELLAAVASLLVPMAPPTGAAVLFTKEIADRISLAANRLDGNNVTECVAILERVAQGD